MRILIPMATKLIFLHGGPGYDDYMSRYFEGKFPETFELVFYTQLKSATITIDILVEELGQFIGPGPTILIGHSWGAVLATEYLKRTKDEHIKGIVFINGFLCTEHITTEYKKELAARGMQKPNLEQIFFTQRELPHTASLHSLLKSTYEETTFRTLWDNFVSRFDNRKYAKLMKVPLLNILGDGDIRIPSRIVRTYADLNPKIRNVEILGAGHFPFLLDEDLKQVAQAIESFVLETVPKP